MAVNGDVEALVASQLSDKTDPSLLTSKEV